jgi:hypothetical protein
MKKHWFQEQSIFSWIHLHAEELSITVVPAAANFGAHSKKFLLQQNKSNVCFLSYLLRFHPYNNYSFTIKAISLPTDLSEATRIIHQQPIKNSFC